MEGGYNRRDGPQRHSPLAVQLPLRQQEPGGAARELRDPRARARALAHGDPRRPLRPQPDDAARACPHPRPPPGRARARRVGDRPPPRAALPRELKLATAAPPPPPPRG